MPRPLSLLCLSALSLLAGCQSTPPLPQWQAPAQREAAQTGQIIELASGRVLTPEQLLTQLRATPRLIVGEKHDNPDHHALQLWLLRALPERSLLLEMLEPVQQPAVTTLQQQLRNGQWPQDLPKALNWQRGWDWQQYGPLLLRVLPGDTQVLAANLDRSEMKAIYRNPPALAGSASTAPAVQSALAAQIRESHCNMLPETQLPAMLAIQQQRDRRMAERLRDAQAPAVLLAGSQHARRDLGVPLHLADLGSAARVLILAEAGDTVSAAEGDYVWYTPATAPQDYCAQLQKR